MEWLERPDRRVPARAARSAYLLVPLEEPAPVVPVVLLPAVPEVPAPVVPPVVPPLVPVVVPAAPVLPPLVPAVPLPASVPVREQP